MANAATVDVPEQCQIVTVRQRRYVVTDVRALQAPFRNGVEIEDYQLDPLVRAVQMPRANLLIADDASLGKTIKAGLAIQESIVRNRARTVLVVWPACRSTGATRCAISSASNSASWTAS